MNEGLGVVGGHAPSPPPPPPPHRTQGITDLPSPEEIAAAEGTADPWEELNQTGLPKVDPKDYEVVAHNVKMLQTLTEKKSSTETAIRRFDIEHLNIEHLNRLVSAIPPLRKYKIVELAGAGTQKYAYALDNGHIFSLFQSGYGGGLYDDLEWYAGIQDRQFKGLSSIDEPAIHDYGEVKISQKLSSYQGNYLKYVEMSGVIPLSMAPSQKLFAMGVKDARELDWEFQVIIQFVSNAYHDGALEDIKGTENRIEQVQYWWLNPSQAPFFEDLYGSVSDVRPDKLPRDDGMNLIKTIVRLVDRVGHPAALDDLHIGNFGMSIENPDEFVVIDI